MARLTDREALAQLSPAARSLIKRKGWVRCKLAENAWHASKAATAPDWGNGPEPHAQAYACQVRGLGSSWGPDGSG